MQPLIYLSHEGDMEHEQRSLCITAPNAEIYGDRDVHLAYDLLVYVLDWIRVSTIYHFIATPHLCNLFTLLRIRYSVYLNQWAVGRV
jgi:hypothetical protein